MNFESKFFPISQVDNAALSTFSEGTPQFVDLFCGGGLVRQGLSPRWQCKLAVDWDEIKHRAYQDRWKDDAFELADVASLNPGRIGRDLDLLWSSFPCQDLSLAGNRLGLSGARSGHFWAVMDLVKNSKVLGLPPKVLAFENVPGFVSQANGRDVALAIQAIASEGYSVTMVVIDAKLFVAQSRPRLFILAFRSDLNPPACVLGTGSDWLYPSYLTRCIKSQNLANLPAWFWLNAPLPRKHRKTLSKVMDWGLSDEWWDREEDTAKIIALMSDEHLAKLERFRQGNKRHVFGLYRRMRPTNDGVKVQRAEVSFNSYAGCLRAPTGGSSRQKFLFIEGDSFRTRLATPKELCKIMGTTVAPFKGHRYNSVYKVLGEGVSPPVIRYLDKHFLSNFV